MAEKTVIPKLSVKALGCNPKAASALKEGDTTPVPLCKVWGVATGVKQGEAANGQIWTALSGRFEGTNIQDGDGTVFQSGKLFLPTGFQEVIEGALAEAIDAEVQFGLEIRAVRASNPIGYSYQAVVLVPPRENDALSQLRDWVLVKSLPAPAPQQRAPQASPPVAESHGVTSLPAPPEPEKKGGKR